MADLKFKELRYVV